jgi:cation:H+ antiporter
MLPILLLLAGFLFLLKGASILVEGATSIARKLNISDLAVGLTVVAFGTSAPELFVNLVASAQGNPGIAIGNVLGSNIANILLILGVSAIIFPLTVTKGTVWNEIPLSLLAALLLGIMANDRLIDGADLSAVTRVDGLVFLAFFIIFISYTASIARRISGTEDHVPRRLYGMFRSTAYVVLGLAGLGLGGKWIVDGAVVVAESIGVSQSLIGLTIVAVGTSLPELFTSAVAAIKKNAEIAVGNVIGSNIFNIFFVLGLSSIVRPLPFGTSSTVDIGVVVGASILLLVFMFSGKRGQLGRAKGVVFVCLYAMYLTYIVMRG